MNRIVFLISTWIVGVNGSDSPWINHRLLYKEEMK